MSLTMRIIFDVGIIGGFFDSCNFYNAEITLKDQSKIKGTVIFGNAATPYKEMLVFRENAGGNSSVSKGEKLEVICVLNNSTTPQIEFNAKVLVADPCIAVLD